MRSGSSLLQTQVLAGLQWIRLQQPRRARRSIRDCIIIISRRGGVAVVSLVDDKSTHLHPTERGPISAGVPHQKLLETGAPKSEPVAAGPLAALAQIAMAPLTKGELRLLAGAEVSTVGSATVTLSSPPSHSRLAGVRTASSLGSPQACLDDRAPRCLARGWYG